MFDIVESKLKTLNGNRLDRGCTSNTFCAASLRPTPEGEKSGASTDLAPSGR